MRRWLWVLVLAGCPPVSPSPDASVDASVSVDVLGAHCAAVSRAQCEWLQRCGVRSTQVPCGAPATDCAEAVRPLFDDAVMRFDADASRECLAQWAGYPCAQWLETSPPSCSRVFVGVAIEGASCGVCAPGYRCERRPDACGACVVATGQPYRYPVGGEACSSRAVDGPDCAGGFVCWYGDGGSYCEALVALGGACEGQLPCVMGATCSREDGGATCRAFRELGGECDAQHPCKQALLCSSGRCVKALAAGETCGNSQDCESARCEGGVCAPLVAALGESCAAGPCGSGLFCGSDSRCAARFARGAACSVDQQCEAGSECVAGICHNRLIDCR